jgi:FO synthase subunit 2
MRWRFAKTAFFLPQAGMHLWISHASDTIGAMQKPMPSHRKSATLNALNTSSLLESVMDGRELSSTEALHLLRLEKKEDLASLREAADTLRQRQVGDTVLYTTGASLFLTNLCEMSPTLYPYPKTPGQDHSRTLTIDDLDTCLEAVKYQQLNQLSINSGGFWPYLQIPGLESPNILKTYANVFGYIHDKAHDLKLIGLSPDEVEFLCILADRNARYVLEMLHDHGLRVLGGNGVEILVDDIRRKIALRKTTVKRWFEIVAQAYQLEIPVIGKLEAGPLETLQQRVTHLEKMRAFLKKHPGAFLYFVPQMWERKPAQPNSMAPARTSRVTSFDRLKLTAVARLFLGDVLPNQQVFWQLNSDDRAQTEESQDGLQWGTNHIGGTDALAYPAFLSGSHIVERFTEADMQRLITETGRPHQRVE